MQEGKGKETGKGKKDNGEAKGNAQTHYSYFAVCVASGATRRPSAGSRRETKEVNLRPQQSKRL